MKIIKTISFSLLIFLGIFLIRFGEMDDSPGAQFLGLVFAIIGAVRLFKLYRIDNKH